MIGHLPSYGSLPPRKSMILHRRVLIIIVLFSSGFFLSNLLRNVNGIVAPDLIATFSLDKQDLGFITSLYFISFALAQLPLGIAIDHFGPRTCQIVLMLFAILGCVLFGTAQSPWVLAVARLAMGLGFSGSLMTGLVAVAKVIPAEQRPGVYGLYMSLGGLGTLFAGYPTHTLLSLIGWRGVFLFLAVVCLLSLCAMFFYQEDQKKTSEKQGVIKLWQPAEFQRILSERSMQAVVPFISVGNGIFMACLGIWMADFMRRAQSLPEVEIGSIISLMAIVLTIGPPVMGWLISRRERWFPGSSLHKAVFWLTLPAPLFFLLAVVPEALLPYPPHWNWLFVGLFFTPSIQCYVLATQNTPEHQVGRVNSTLNFTLFLGGFIIQYGIGVFLNWLTISLGYSDVFSYRLVMVVNAIIILLCVIWIPYRLRDSKSLGKNTDESQPA